MTELEWQQQPRADCPDKALLIAGCLRKMMCLCLHYFQYPEQRAKNEERVKNELGVSKGGT